MSPDLVPHAAAGRPAAGRPAADLPAAPRSRRRGRAGSRTATVLAAATVAVAASLALAACGASFDPTGPCTADGSAPGSYADLEATIPKVYDGAGPTELDSGRACTTAGLGTLDGHGVKELRFAGATWSTGTDSGLSLAIFTAADGPTLDPAWMAEFYETSARTNGKNVTSIETTTYQVTPTVSASRLDVLNGESYQSVVVWRRNGQVAVAVVADFIREIQTKEAHDKIVRAAVDAFGG